jgi:hypothetical protein
VQLFRLKPSRPYTEDRKQVLRLTLARAFNLACELNIFFLGDIHKKILQVAGCSFASRFVRAL